MKLNQIKDNPGARRKARPLGRGIGSGRGKTCGRGGKGQTARSGVRLKGFQGGQMPLSRRLPKRGFTPLKRANYAEINVGQIQHAIDHQKLSAAEKITPPMLQAAGFFKTIGDGIRLLGKGVLSIPLHIEVTAVSHSAREMIEALGGSVTLIKG